MKQSKFIWSNDKPFIVNVIRSIIAIVFIIVAIPIYIVKQLLKTLRNVLVDYLFGYLVIIVQVLLHYLYSICEWIYKIAFKILLYTSSILFDLIIKPLQRYLLYLNKHVFIPIIQILYIYIFKPVLDCLVFIAERIIFPIICFIFQRCVMEIYFGIRYCFIKIKKILRAIITLPSQLYQFKKVRRFFKIIILYLLVPIVKLLQLIQLILECISTILEKLWDLFDVILKYPFELLIGILYLINSVLNKILGTFFNISKIVYHSAILKNIKHIIKGIFKLAGRIIQIIIQVICAVINAIYMIWRIAYVNVKYFFSSLNQGIFIPAYRIVKQIVQALFMPIKYICNQIQQTFVNGIVDAIQFLNSTIRDISYFISDTIRGTYDFLRNIMRSIVD